MTLSDEQIDARLQGLPADDETDDIVHRRAHGHAGRHNLARREMRWPLWQSPCLRPRNPGQPRAVL